MFLVLRPYKYAKSILIFKMFGSKVIEEVSNQFGTFTVEELTYEGRSARVLFSAPQHAAQAGIPLDDDERLLFDYNQLFLDLATSLQPKNVLVLGGGTLTLPTALVAHLPTVKITAVEINSDLIKLAAKYFGYRPNKRLRVVIRDAKEFMQLAKPTFDLIVVDLYDNFTIPKHFLGNTFAAQLKLGLNSGGMVATNCIAATTGEEAVHLRRLVDSYRSEIGKVRILKPNNRYMGWLSQNLIVLSGENIERVLPSFTEVNLR